MLMLRRSATTSEQIEINGIHGMCFVTVLLFASCCRCITDLLNTVEPLITDTLINEHLQ
jgi:hypothetical protein